MLSTLPKYDVFLSFRGPDTRRNFISFLHKELVRRSIRTFKDDNDLKIGRTISAELLRAIAESKFGIVVISKNFAASSWCLKELVKIMEAVDNGSLTVMPVFYGVHPSHLRRNSGEIAEQFKKHEAREDSEEVFLWREALNKLSNISGDCSSEWEDDSKLVDGICDRISKKRMITTRTISNGFSLVGIDAHMQSIHRLMASNSNNKSVRVIGIWARGDDGRSALAKSAYHDLQHNFEKHCYLKNVKNITHDRHMSHLREEFRLNLQGEHSSSKSRLKDQKILLVANEIDTLEQLDTLAEDFNNFGPGSIVIITTINKQLFVSFGIKHVYEVEQPKFQKVRELFRQIAFKKRGIIVAFGTVFNGAKDFVTERLSCLPGKSLYSKL